MKNTKLQNPSLRMRKGFTLIELIVVIAILAILAAIAIPSFVNVLNTSKVSAAMANHKTVVAAVAVSQAESGGTLPATGIATLAPYLANGAASVGSTSGSTTEWTLNTAGTSGTVVTTVSVQSTKFPVGNIGGVVVAYTTAGGTTFTSTLTAS